MKTLLLSLATLAAASTVTAGTVLTSGQLLTPPQQARANATMKAPQRAWFNPQTANYYRVARSLEDQNGDVDFDQSLWGGNSLKLTLPEDGQSGQATIERLVDFGDNYQAKTTYDIVGDYDATARTLTIPTPFDQSGIGNATRVADIDYHGSSMQAVMVGCEVSSRPDQTGQYPIYLNDELVFDVADDGTLAARGEWLVYCFGDTQNGIFRLYRDTELLAACEQATIVARPATVDFPEAMVGVKQQQNIYVANIGKTEAAMEYNITGDAGLQLAAAQYVGTMYGQKFVVMLTPEEAGTFNGLIQMRDQNTQSMAQVEVTATVEAAPDFSQVVKEGEFEFSMPQSQFMNYLSFSVSDQRTGSPVAEADMSATGVSAILAAFTVPQGEVGVLSFGGVNHSMQPNGFNGILDDEWPMFYNDVYDHPGVTAPWPVSAITACAQGDHVLEIDYLYQMDWYARGYDQQWAYFNDLSLVTTPEKANAAMLIDRTADFGSHYRDRYAAKGEHTVQLLNLGTEPLQVTGSTGSDNFRVLPLADTADQFAKLPVVVEFTGDALGDYDETMTIQTNAGDYELRCTATVEQLPYDYSPIVAKGDFSFDTSDPWPFTLDAAKGEAFSSNFAAGSAENFSGTLYSWLTARFLVPDGCTGTLAWDGVNSSIDFFSFMGQDVMTDGTTIYIDGQKAGEFAGECECGSADLDESLLTFTPGMHSIMFQYQKKDSEPAGDDRVTISNLSLTLDGGTGVESVESASSKAVYYDLQGRRVANPSHGIYVRVRDGKAVKVRM